MNRGDPVVYLSAVIFFLSAALLVLMMTSDRKSSICTSAVIAADTGGEIFMRDILSMLHDEAAEDGRRIYIVSVDGEFSEEALLLAEKYTGIALMYADAPVSEILQAEDKNERA